MTSLDFLSPDRCAPQVALVSPLARALAGVDPARVLDLSHLGKLEVRGDVDALEPEPGDDFHRLGARHGLYVHDGPTSSLRAELRERGFYVVDQTAAYAALEIRGEDLLRRLTDLDPAALPTAGILARVTAVVARGAGDAFVIFVAQEHGHYVAEAVLDALEGLGR